MTSHAQHDNPNHWSRAAEFYERHAEPFTRPFAEAALSYLPNMAGRRLLDVATGTGVVARAAAEAGAEVLATDFAKEMVARAQTHLERYAGCEAQVMDGQQLALPTAHFDTSVSMFGVMMFPDYRRGLAELVRVTRPGGHVVVGVWDNPQGAGPNLLILDFLARRHGHITPPEPTSGMAVLSKPEGLRAELRAAGCDTVDVHPVTGSWQAKHIEDALRQVTELLSSCPAPLYQTLDQAVRAELLEDLRSTFARCVRPDGSIALPAGAYIGVGHR